jgi:hypothetical protein
LIKSRLGKLCLLAKTKTLLRFPLMEFWLIFSGLCVVTALGFIVLIRTY